MNVTLTNEGEKKNFFMYIHQELKCMAEQLNGSTTAIVNKTIPKAELLGK